MRSVLVVAALVAGVGCSGEPVGASDNAPAAGAPPPLAPDGPTVATVGDGFVTEADFATAASRSPSADQGELDLASRKQILDTLVTDEMMFQEATSRGLYRDPKVRKIMVSLLVRSEVYDRVRASDFTAEELRAYYDDHREEFTVPEKAQVRRIFIGISDERTQAEAQTLIDEIRAKILKDPSVFGDLAQKHSEDPYKRRGGDLGFITREGKPGIPPEVVEQAFSLVPGRLSKPFESGGGLNLVLTVAKREAVERTFEQMKGSVLRRMKNDRFQVLTQEYVEEIRERYPVKIDEAALAAVSIDSRAAPPGPDPGDLLDDLGPGRPGGPPGVHPGPVVGPKGQR